MVLAMAHLRQTTVDKITLCARQDAKKAANNGKAGALNSWPMGR
jgi:hypothetical protein